MSKYVNLDDPEVRYYMNFGRAEGYIISPEAERIDLVRCGECKWHDGEYHCLNTDTYAFDRNDFCSRGERREDD